MVELVFVTDVVFVCDVDKALFNWSWVWFDDVDFAGVVIADDLPLVTLLIWLTSCLTLLIFSSFDGDESAC